MRPLLVLGLIVALLPTPAAAWGPKVHRIVCTHAWNELTEPARDKIREILGITAREQFAAHCVRPDDRIKDHPETASWHILYVPREAAVIDLARDCPLPASCVVREIERTIAVLKSDAPREDKAGALGLLAHLVADAHQPLNMGLAADQGGAGVSATFLGEATTMRGIWDEHLFAKVPEPTAPDGILRLYGIFFGVGGPRDYWLQTTPVDWTRESMWIARTPATAYIGNPGDLAFDEAYIKQNQSVALEQVYKAWLRLTQVLLDVLK